MKKVYLFLFGVLLSTAGIANAATNTYTIDDQVVEAAFEQSLFQMSPAEASFTSALNQRLAVAGLTVSRADNPDPVIALVLNFLLGYFGVHRVYLGASFKQVILYTITLGGFGGILPMIDLIALIIAYSEGDISKYVGNDKFFMWAGEL